MNDLTILARRINEREKDIEALRKLAIEKVNDTLREVLLQGQDLIEMKSRCRHGTWLNQLRVTCPMVSERRAERYMALARSVANGASVDEAQSLRSLLAICGMEGEEERQEPKRWPSYLEAIGRLSKVVGYVTKFPVAQWPSEGVDKFREQLFPIARELWPDKFTDTDKHI
jgi:hypothetical protein